MKQGASTGTPNNLTADSEHRSAGRALSSTSLRIALCALVPFFAAGSLHAVLPNNALDFDGTGDYLQAASGIDTGLTQVTLEAWVYHRTVPTSVQRYLTVGNGVAVLRHDGADSQGELHFYIKDSVAALHSLRVANVLQPDRWYHVAGTWDGTDLKLYVDGVRVGQDTPAGPITLATPDGSATVSHVTETMDGTIDELRIWNHARTPAEIRDDMHHELSGSETGLVHYWKLDESVGSTADDSAGSADLTLYNMDLSDWVASTAPFDIDLGDAPAPFPTLLADNGGRHADGGATLGSLRDIEADGQPTADADGDDVTDLDDEDGVSGWTGVRAGAHHAAVTVNVQSGPAKLDAWVDWDGDGNWGGILERIADGLTVSDGDNVLDFPVPSWAVPGATTSRFRLSSDGGVGPSGLAADGELEDHPLSVASATAGAGGFNTGVNLSGTAGAFYSQTALAAGDLDGDGDADLLVGHYSSPPSSADLYWYENLGLGSFTGHPVQHLDSDAFMDNALVDLDGDGDLDAVSALNVAGLAWHENDGAGNFINHLVASCPAQIIDESVRPADLDGDGDLDLVYSDYVAKLLWCENDGSENFTQHSFSITGSGHIVGTVADLDGDGDLDLVVGNEMGGGVRLRWYENQGDQTFVEHLVSDGPVHWTSAAAVDLDGDGDLDLAAVGSRSSPSNRYMLAWWENDGSSGFATLHTMVDNSTYVPLADLQVADMDGDGDMDLIATGDGPDLAWYENDGAGAFAVHVVGNQANPALATVAADTDGDGDLDLFSIGEYSKQGVYWYENGQPDIQLSGNGQPIADGDDTPAAANGTLVALATPGQTFDQVFTIENSGAGVLRLTGIPAVQIGGHDPGQFSVTAQPPVTVLAPGQSTTFTLRFTAGTTPASEAVLSISSNDPDEAPYDFLVRSYEDGYDWGDAPEPYATNWPDGGPYHAATGPTLGALRDKESAGEPSDHADSDDSQGVDDEDGVSGWTGVQVGRLDASVTVNVQGGTAKLDAWIDWNRDGNWGGLDERIADGLDLAVGDNVVSFDVPYWASAGTTYARFRLSSAGHLPVGGAAADGEVEDDELTIQPAVAGTRSFAAGVPITTGLNGTIVDFVAADVDQDGDLDLAVADVNGIAWHEQSGGGFVPHPLGDYSNYQVYATDIDGDGDVDLLGSGDGITVLRNDGSEGFTPESWLDAWTYRFFCLGDLDGDGDLDAPGEDWAAGGRVGYDSGGGVFDTYSQLATGVRYWYRPECIDLDRDGQLDVVAGQWQDLDPDLLVSWLESEGSGVYASTDVPSTLGLVGGRGTAARDLDGDGDFDLVATAEISNSVAWYRNDGSESFTEILIHGATGGARGVFACDLDGDGDEDVLATGFSDDSLAWFENDGNANFVRHPIATSADGPTKVIAADVDGDGDLDVVVASENDHTLRWFEQKPAFVFGDGFESGDTSAWSSAVP